MKVALVTGGNRGIGFAVCEALAERKCKVLLGSRNYNLGLEAAEKLKRKGLDVEAVHLDLSTKENIEKTAKEIDNTCGCIDILVNNAGVLARVPLLEATDAEIQEGLQVNLFGPLYCIRTFAPGMIKKGYGRIVNVSSGWGSFDEGLDGPAIYCISKAALNALTVTSAHSFPSNVKINSMCPGWVNTRMGGESAPLKPSEGADTIVWLATLPESGPTGKFFRERKEISW